jgi:hypothetical protein
MDATRSRRTHDEMRLRWYALWRLSRFAAHMGFAAAPRKDPDRRHDATRKDDKRCPD